MDRGGASRACCLVGPSRMASKAPHALRRPRPCLPTSSGSAMKTTSTRSKCLQMGERSKWVIDRHSAAMGLDFFVVFGRTGRQKFLLGRVAGQVVMARGSPEYAEASAPAAPCTEVVARRFLAGMLRRAMRRLGALPLIIARPRCIPAMNTAWGRSNAIATTAAPTRAARSELADIRMSCIERMLLM